MLEKIKVVLRHNQGLAVAVMVVIVLGVWIIGCESTVSSPINNTKTVNRVQLDADVERLMVDIQLAYEDLAKQDLFKEKLFEIGVMAAQGGTINPVGAGVTLLSILGLGAAVDNRKKDSIIKTLQGKSNETSA